MKVYIQHIIAAIVMVIPFILIAIFYEDLPNEIPIHWGLNGEPDDWAPKHIGIWILPIVSIFSYLLLGIIHKIDPKKNIELFKKTINTIRLILVLFLTVLFVATLFKMMDYAANLDLIPIVIVSMFLILGNYMGKMRPNYFIGVRTPWTLENEEVWRKTHRLTGYIWVIASGIMLVILLLNFKTGFSIIFAIYIIAIALVPILYSFIIYKQLPTPKQ